MRGVPAWAMVLVMRTSVHRAFSAALAAGLATALAVALAAAGPAHASSAMPAVVTMDQLDSVAVVSGSNAWAVGYSTTTGWDHTLIERWNGTSWKIVASPN